jgi:hypothetical protein
MLAMLNQPVGQGLIRLGLIRLFLLMNNKGKTEEIISGNLKYSNAIKKRLVKINSSMQLFGKRITDQRLYEMFEAADICVFEMAFLISFKRQRNVDKYFKRADEFKRYQQNRLMNGMDIQKILNSGPGEHIGRIQAVIERKRFLGSIKNKTEARAWIISNLT